MKYVFVLQVLCLYMHCFFFNMFIKDVKCVV